MRSYFYPFANWVLTQVFSLVLRWHVEQRAPVPNGPIIVAANHCSSIDPPLINASLGRRVLFLAKKEILETGGWKAWVIAHYGAIPLDRRGFDRRALRQAARALDAGAAIGFFPEGTRSPTGALQRGKRGSAYFPLSTHALIVPVAIIGSDRVRTLRDLLRRPPVTVVIGQAFELPEHEKGRGAEHIEEATETIMQHIAQLLPPDRQGAYRATVSESV